MLPHFIIELDYFRSRWIRFGIILLVSGVYLLFSFSFRYYLGNEISAIALFPVVLASWNLGLKAGMVWSLALVALDICALHYYSQLAIGQILSRGMVADFLPSLEPVLSSVGQEK